MDNSTIMIMKKVPVLRGDVLSDPELPLLSFSLNNFVNTECNINIIIFQETINLLLPFVVNNNEIG